MSFRSDKLEFVGNHAIQGNRYAFAVRMADGSVSAWGDKDAGGDISSVREQLKNVQAICAGYRAFAAIVEGGKVVTWGHAESGGDSSAVASELTQVEGICASGQAFAALRRDGTVVAWGHKDFGGDLSAVASRLKQVKAIYSTYSAFTAVLHDGNVIAWGDRGAGGDSGVRGLKHIDFVAGCEHAFAARLRDSSVLTWGSQDKGADILYLDMKDIVKIRGARYSFAGIKKDGTTIVWGRRDCGGDNSGVRNSLVQVEDVTASLYAFAARKKNGTVVTWGDVVYGANSSMVAGELKDVVTICATYGAFAALRKDGTVVVWGNQVFGGDASSVKDELTEVESLSSTSHAFAARRKDGTVVTWGNAGWGGDSSSVPALRQPGSIGSEEKGEVKGPEAPEVPAHKDGSVEFWMQELFGVVDDEDLQEVGRLLNHSGFKKKHLGRFTRQDLKAAGLNQGFIKDILEYQGPIAKVDPLVYFPMIRKIPEEELVIGEPIEDGEYVRATWSRSLGEDNVSLQVAVAVIESEMTDEMLQGLAAITTSPQQNILTFHGVCNSVPPKFVYELMSTNLAKLIREKRLTKYPFLLQVLRDVAAGLAHLHALGVTYHGLKPSNVLIRKEQVKLCDAGSTDSQPADQLAFASLLFECVTGSAPRDSELPQLVEELKQAGCHPALLRMFIECNARNLLDRPPLPMMCSQLQTLIVEDAIKHDRLKELLKLAEDQDWDIYNTIWKYYDDDSTQQFLAYVRGSVFGPENLSQPLQSKGQSAFEELSKLADSGSSRLHQFMQQAVEMSRGKYIHVPRKSETSCLIKAQEQFGGDYARVLDLERATGVFEDGSDLQSCVEELKMVEGLRVVRLEDCFNNPFKYGKRAAVLSVCEVRSGLIGELVLTFSKLADVKSQTVRIIEISRRSRF